MQFLETAVSCFWGFNPCKTVHLVGYIRHLWVVRLVWIPDVRSFGVIILSIRQQLGYCVLAALYFSLNIVIALVILFWGLMFVGALFNLHGTWWYSLLPVFLTTYFTWVYLALEVGQNEVLSVPRAKIFEHPEKNVILDLCIRQFRAKVARNPFFWWKNFHVRVFLVNYLLSISQYWSFLIS